MRYRVLVLLLLVAGVACGDDTSADANSAPADAGLDAETDLGRLPPTAFARTLDELPPGTEVVSKEEFDARVESGELVVVSIQTLQEAEVAAAEQEAADDAFIAQWEAEHPGIKLLPNEPQGPGLAALPNGNTLITVELANGNERTFEQPGERWLKRTVVETIRSFPTRDNQAALYTELYGDIPISYRDSLGLVDPATVAADPETFPAEAVQDLNDSIVERVDEFVSYEPDPTVPPGYVSDCDDEEHAGEGSDRTGNVNDIACQPNPDGIWTNIDFPLKWYATCVKDQAVRGTCTAFDIAATLEIWIAKLENRWVNLSEQALYRKAKFDWQYPRRDMKDGHLGSSILIELTTLEWGVPYEDFWSYNPSLQRETVPQGDASVFVNSCDGYDGPCSDSSHQTPMVCADVGGAVECAYSWTGIPTGTPRVTATTASQLWDREHPELSVDLMRLALWSGDPIALGYVCGWRCGHSVALVGFVDNEDLAEVLPDHLPGAGGGYVIIKNSYSDCYADGGYEYFSYAELEDKTLSAVAVHGAAVE